jgi:cysteinyl-tRNA synthetase
VYDDAHIGHARTYVTLDVIRRVLERERAVLFALGVTDIDDKIVARARADGTTPRAIAARFERSFLDDLAALRVRPPTTLARVSEHIPDVLAFASALVEQGAAYVVARPSALGDGGASVYLDVRALGDAYGKLAPREVKQERTEVGGGVAGAGAAGGVAGEGAGEDPDAAGRAWPKRDTRDFALWRGVSAADAAGRGSGRATASPSDGGEAGGWAWASPWGMGRPGWHLECSAMTRALFGAHLDVHAGGVDLRFPHHCNECAQADAMAGPTARAAGYAWVRAWVHTGHVHIDGRKMSKSLKNFVRVRDLLAPGGDADVAVRAAWPEGSVADAFRLWCVRHHYAEALTYAPARMGDVGDVARRLDSFLRTARALLDAPSTVAGGGGGGADGGSSSSSDGGGGIDGGGARYERWTAADNDFAKKWARVRGDAAAALADDFDTPRALRALSEGASAGARYVAAGGVARGLLASVARELAGELAAFGLGFGAAHAAALEGVGDAPTGAERGTAGATQRAGREVAALVVEHRAELRERAADARKALRAGGADAARDALATLLRACDAACDETRDELLPRLGWKVADTPSGPRLTRE